MRQIFLDTETTGLDAAGGDRIVEIGCIEMVNRRLTGRTLHRYINPERVSHPDALRVHGLTEDFLSEHPVFAAIAADLAEFITGAELIIHNASFDVGFLDAEFARLMLPPTRELATVTDSLLLARELYPGKANSLDALCKRLEVDNTQRTLHGARLDAGLLAEVYLRMTRGQDSLMVEASGSDTDQERSSSQAVDLSSFTLPVRCASAEEVAAHRAVLAEIDTGCKGRGVWREAEAVAVAPEQSAQEAVA
jgi:DNA polymerase III subunit epsilon